MGSKHAGVIESAQSDNFKQTWSITNLNAVSIWAKNKALAVGDRVLLLSFRWG